MRSMWRRFADWAGHMADGKEVAELGLYPMSVEEDTDAVDAQNRIIIEEDAKHNLCAQVTSSSLTQKTRTTIVYKNAKFYLEQNALSESVPIVVIFKAMGVECDQEVCQLVGAEAKYLEKLAASIQEGSQLNVLSRQ